MASNGPPSKAFEASETTNLTFPPDGLAFAIFYHFGGKVRRGPLRNTRRKPDRRSACATPDLKQGVRVFQAPSHVGQHRLIGRNGLERPRRTACCEPVPKPLIVQMRHVCIDLS